jgi:CheY-like chemotaxis protein
MTAALGERRGFVEILLVEDDQRDAELTRVAMERCKIANHLHVVRDGMEALAFLRREGKFAQVPRPDLILLDLNVPRLDGRDLLATIKEQPSLRTIPVVVLTTSDAEPDIDGSYALHANAYVTKPVEMEDFIKIVQGIDDFWFGLVRLPNRSAD